VNHAEWCAVVAQTKREKKATVTMSVEDAAELLEGYHKPVDQVSYFARPVLPLEQLG
jgi:hypothetical protein